MFPLTSRKASALPTLAAGTFSVTASSAEPPPGTVTFPTPKAMDAGRVCPDGATLGVSRTCELPNCGS